MKKKIFIALILIVGLSGVLFGCNGNKSEKYQEESEGKIKIVATLFPQYDFARQIAGDKAEISLLMAPGVESHSYEPSPADIIKINDADLFIYTGKYMEPWAQSIIDGVENKKVKILDVSQNVTLDKEDEHDEHEGHDEHDSLDGEDGKEQVENEHNAHEFDPHIWTSPVNAKIMVDNILNDLCAIDPENEAYYKKNAEAYVEELKELNNEFKEIFSTAKRSEIIFAGKFALHYFAEEYGMEYEAAFDSCASETEPSVKTVTNLIDEMKEKNIPVVFYPELTDPKVAKAISDETGAEMLLLHSCHNVSKDDFNAGVTYIGLMKENAENLRIGLN